MAWYTRDKRFSDFAVKKINEILRKEGYKGKIVDQKGHDILLKDGRKVEVKFDTFIYQSGNLACEWWSDKPSSSLGWAQYSDADVLVYMYDYDNAYVLDMQELKKYVAHNLSQLEAKIAYRGKSKSQAEVILVPIANVAHLRIKEFEDIIRKYAILPPKEWKSRKQSSLRNFSNLVKFL